MSVRTALSAKRRNRPEFNCVDGATDDFARQFLAW